MTRGEAGCSPKCDDSHLKYFYIYISLAQFVLLCISCDSINMAKISNKKILKRLSVPLKQLYFQFQRIITSPLRQYGLLIHVCLCVKMTAPTGSKTAIPDLFCFVLCHVTYLSNHLYKKRLPFPSIV